MKIMKPKAVHEINGVIVGENVQRAVKLYRDAKYFYRHIDGTLEDDTVMYEVYHYTQEDDSHPGHLSWGLTILYPVTVSDECNMTRGHFHHDTECAEFYYGIAGKGLLLLMDKEGTTWSEEVFPGSLHDIKGVFAHRLINIGTQPLKVAACWPTKAGHNYEQVERKPFGYRVYQGTTGLEIKQEREEKDNDK